MRRITLYIAVATALSAAPSWAQPIADIVFNNGKIYTSDPKLPWASAVAIKKKSIIGIGSNIDAETYVGPKTEVVDLEGRMMLPGLYDTHMHLRIGGQMNSVMLNLFPLKTKEEVEKKIREHAAKLGPNDWVLGTGWKYEHFDEATRQQLDELVGGRPAILSSESQHTGWYSTKALEFFKITAKTKDTPGGKIDREDDGGPRGIMREKAHIAYGFSATPRLFTPDEQEAAVKAGVAIANGLGFIGIQEAASATKEGGEDVYRRVHEKGELNARVEINMVHLGFKSDKENTASLMARRFIGDERVSARTVKFAVDGTPGKFALMHDAYKDGTFGVANYTQERLFAIFDELTERGFRLYVHAEGDHGISRTISAFEYANQTGKPLRKEHRHVITHLDHVRSVDYPRMKRLGLWAQIQPNWMGFDPYDQTVTLPNVGPDRYATKNQYTLLRDAGIPIAAGADWPTGPIMSPWDMIQMGATGQGIGEPEPRTKPFTVAEMVKFFTINGAKLMFRDDISGSLEVGKHADLIVVSQNIMEVPKNQISKTKVLLTMLDGEVVYGDSNWSKVVEGRAPISFNEYMSKSPYGINDEHFLPGVWRVTGGNGVNARKAAIEAPKTKSQLVHLQGTDPITGRLHNPSAINKERAMRQYIQLLRSRFVRARF
ncbi:MAG: amidohydrolase [Hyphomicrobiaceae bacterium]